MACQVQKFWIEFEMEGFDMTERQVKVSLVLNATGFMQGVDAAMDAGARTVFSAAAHAALGLIPGGGVDISANTLTAWLRAIGATISVSTSTARIAAPNVYMPDIPVKPSGVTTVGLGIDSNGKLWREA